MKTESSLLKIIFIFYIHSILLSLGSGDGTCPSCHGAGVFSKLVAHPSQMISLKWKVITTTEVALSQALTLTSSTEVACQTGCIGHPPGVHVWSWLRVGTALNSSSCEYMKT